MNKEPPHKTDSKKPAPFGSPKVIAGIFIFLLFGLAILNLATPPRIFSENENRYLKQFPEFSWQRLFSGKYTAELDEFVTDQFAFRDHWVGAKIISEKLMLKRSSNGVYFMRDGSLSEMFDTVDFNRYRRNLDYVAKFEEGIRNELGIEAHIMLIPSASMIRSHMLPAFVPEVNQRALLDEAAEILPGFIDVSNSLNKHKSEYIYYHTDHHWTSLGAYYSYNTMREELGRWERPIGDYRLDILSSAFYGTTWSKASLYSVPPDTIMAYIPRSIDSFHIDYDDDEAASDSFYQYSYLETKDKYSVFLGGNRPVVRISTGVNNGRRLMLIKDSYANTFAQFLLTDYEEILLLDPRYYRSSHIQFAVENGVTDVLFLFSLKNFADDASIYFIST